jgi:hypothetical protein
MAKQQRTKVVPFPAKGEPSPSEAGALAPFELPVSFNQLVISALNYRRAPETADDRDRELEESIARQGLLQNLNARPHPDGQLFEVFAGGRRVRAISRLVAAGRFGPSALVIPIRVHPGISDVDLILMSLAENHHRRDTHFLEEADAVANTIRLMTGDSGPQRGDGVTATIAERMGCGQRWVQILWQLANDLHPEVKAYFLSRPDLSIDLAKAIRIVPGDLQLRALALLQRGESNGWTPSPPQVRDFLTRDLPLVETAIFDPATYKGGVTSAEPEHRKIAAPAPPLESLGFAGDVASALDQDLDEEVGNQLSEEDDRMYRTLDDLDEDALDTQAGGAGEDEDLGQRFLDVEEFLRLQEEAIEAKRMQLLESYAFVEVLRVRHPAHALIDYLRHDGPEAGALIIVTPDMEITIEAGYVKREETAPQAGDSTPSRPKNPEEEILKEHYRKTARVKTTALQQAVATSPQGAMRALIPALLGSPEVCKIRCEQTFNEDLVVAPQFEADFELLSSLLGKLIAPRKPGEYPRFNFSAYEAGARTAKAAELLADASDTDIERLFTALVAARVGTFAGYNPGPGDPPGAVALANRLGVTAAAQDLTETLQGYRKGHLLRVAAACGLSGEQVAGKTGKELRAAILEAPGAATYYPAELAFGTSEEIAAAISRVGAKPKPSKTAARKKHALK